MPKPKRNDLMFIFKMHLKAIIILLLWLAPFAVSDSSSLRDALDCLSQYIQTFQPKMSQKLFAMFKKSYPNTLNTTVQHFDLTPGSESTYIITGDIEAMWLRDSTNQFLPYMKITENCPKIRELALGLLNTQAQFIMIDPFTNAFKKFQKNIAQRHFYLNDKTQTFVFGLPVDLTRHRQFATQSIWERKFQIDSLASFLRLAYQYHKRYDNLDLINLRFVKALKRLVRAVQQEMKDTAYEERRKASFYSFYRTATELQNGHIKKAFGNGMIKTGFRPSDDPNDCAYNIPGNAMLSTYMNLVASKIFPLVSEKSVFKKELTILGNKMINIAETIKEAILQYGVVQLDNRKIFAYEVSGSGQNKTFDDANLPSLLSLSYLLFVDQNNTIYANTRKHVLSVKNPYYYHNQNIKGIGSSHTPNGNIWPLALITQILTSHSKEEIRNCLESLKQHSVDDLNHESFSVHNPRSNTRAWFAWANSLFGEMIITISQKYPDTLQ